MEGVEGLRVLYNLQFRVPKGRIKRTFMPLVKEALAQHREKYKRGQTNTSVRRK